MNKIIIAIDGYSSCGKSSTAKGVAACLNYAYIDTGAMYRAVTLYFINHHVSLKDKNEIKQALKKINIDFKRNENGENQTYLNGVNVEVEIRKMHVANKVSVISAFSDVRTNMVALQRKMGLNKGLVMDGRDIGSVVFPQAELKLFMTADPSIRAQRRQLELAQKGEQLSLHQIIANIKKRDHLDTTRTESPLIKVDDALVIDTSTMKLEEQIEQVCQLAKKIIYSS